jgi:uncharacterized protein YodC (DUF2158 family)
MALAAGRTARLNSGGPLMTVREVEGDTVRCDWFDKEGRLRNAEFLANQVHEDSGGDTLAKLLEQVEAEKVAGATS